MNSIFNFLLFLSVVALNYLSNALPLNGVTQAEISARYPIPLTPAGFTFSIWGVIYLGLTAYIIVQALPKYRNEVRLRTLDLPFRLSCLFNSIWLVVWHYGYVSLSVVFMLGLLGSLMLAYIRLDRGQVEKDELSKWMVGQTFSVYMGWVSLATMINISVLLYSLGWSGGGISPEGWTVILLVIASGLFVYLGTTFKDSAVLGVLVWASFGIAVKNQDTQIILGTCIAVFLFSLLMAIRVWLMRRSV